MPLDFWIALWKIVLIAGVAMFGALAIVVSIGGARDIVRLLRRLQPSAPADPAESEVKKPE